MSKFVNYKKRDFELPPGCKNLIDVLRPPSLRDLQGITEADLRSCVTRGGRSIGGLKDIEKYVSMAFESRALRFTLIIIALTDKRLTIDVDRILDGTMEASVGVQMDTEDDTAVCGFFTRHNLHAPVDSGVPQHFNPNLPIHVRYHIVPVPTDAAQLARLLADLFREVCGLTDESNLIFRYDEVSKVT